MDLSIPALLGVAVALMLGGFVKGAIGFGMPLISVPLLALIIDVRLVLALMTVPIIAVNIRQTFRGGLVREIVSRFWWLLAAMTVGFAIGGLLVVRLDPDLLVAVVGVVVMIFVLTSAFQPDMALPDRLIRPVGVGAGMAGGLVGGLSTFFGPPILMFLLAARLPTHLYVATIGAIWLWGGLLLILTYSAVNILTLELAFYSVLCVLPSLVGMRAGEWFRGRINQRVFRAVTLVVLFLVGLSMLRHALL